MLSRSVVLIHKHQTAVRIYCNGDGRIADAPSISIYPFLKSCLTEYKFDPRQKRNIVSYCFFIYNKETGVLHMPVSLLYRLTQYLAMANIGYTIENIQPNDSIPISLVENEGLIARSDQIGPIGFLSSDQSMRALDLQTGKGKTFIAIKAIIKLSRLTLIIVPASLVPQWSEAISNMCDARISIIRGSKSIQDIVDSGYKQDADIYIASINTLQEYATMDIQYSAYPSIQEFMRNMRFGVKVVDECHTNFHAITMIDIQCDICYNLYLSATYMRSARMSDKIFKLIFPDEIKYDVGEYNKYVNITEGTYYLGNIPDKYVSTSRGYMHAKYESYLLRAVDKMQRLFNEVFTPVVDDYFMKIKTDGQKLLILVGTVDFGDTLVEFLRDVYTDVQIASYFSSTADDVLLSSDIIVSTIGSMGTGRDLKGLRSVILFVSFGSEALTYQTIGRLRVMDDTPEFVYLVNQGLNSHLTHANKRRIIYRHIGKRFQTLNLQ